MQTKAVPTLFSSLVFLSLFPFLTSTFSAATSTSTSTSTSSSLADTAKSSDGLMQVSVSGARIYVNEKPYFIRGVNYSPTPMGQSPIQNWPYGDYMSWEFQDLWERDFPLLRSLGANTIRVYGWNNNIDHGLFLDTANRHGLKVIITFNVGNTWQNPVQEEWQRQGLLGTFMWQFKKYLNHPAILGWSFGSEVNGAWNNFLGAFSNAYGCNWNGGAYPWDPNGCYGNDKGDGPCQQPIACVYTHLFQFLNQAAQYAKAAMGDKRRHLIMVSFADADAVLFRLERFEQFAPDIDAWGMQLYRGRDFGRDSNDFLRAFGKSSTKPLVVTEYGVDAYNDPCGNSDKTPCYNTAEKPPNGYGEDEAQQADWNFDLTELLLNQSSADGHGHVAGGFIMGYVDENWKTSVGVVGCHGPIPYGMPGFDASLCDWKAHVTCPATDLSHPNLCGWYTPATFDSYSNVGWFGLMRPSPSGNGDIDRLTPRQSFAALQRLWRGPTSSVWIWLSLAVLAIALIILLLAYFRYQNKKEAAAEKQGFPAAATATAAGAGAGARYGTTGGRTRAQQNKKMSLNAAPDLSTAVISHMFQNQDGEGQKTETQYPPPGSPSLPPTSIPPTITVVHSPIRASERTPLIHK